MADRVDSTKKVLENDTVDLLAIDRAVYDWFNTKHALKIKGRKTPVIFGSWERFAQMHETKDDETLNSLRDSKGMLKLPIISIKRGDISSNEQMYKKINVNGEPSVSIIKKIADSKFDKNRRVPFNDKEYLVPPGRYRKDNPVYEIHRLPFPEFLLIPYTITFWSSYIKHANAFNNMLWPLHDFPDLTYKEYHFHGKIDTSTNESNVETFTDEDRIIRNSFNMEVQGYIFDKSQIIIERTSTKISFDVNMLEKEEILVDEDIDSLVSKYTQGENGGSFETINTPL